MAEPTQEQVDELLREAQAYLAFWAVVKPIVALPRVKVNAARMRRRISRYGGGGVAVESAASLAQRIAAYEL